VGSQSRFHDQGSRGRHQARVARCRA
jgi:hypothetical protein